MKVSQMTIILKNKKWKDLKVDVQKMQRFKSQWTKTQSSYDYFHDAECRMTTSMHNISKIGMCLMILSFKKKRDENVIENQEEIELSYLNIYGIIFVFHPN